MILKIALIEIVDNNIFFVNRSNHSFRRSRSQLDIFLIYRIVNDLEQQLSNPSVFNSLLSKLIMSKFSSILAICLITFTSFLVSKTLKIQHSCSPMLYSGKLPSECQIASNNLTSRDLSKSPLPKQTARNSQAYFPEVSHSKTVTKPETQLNPQQNQIAYDSDSPNNDETELKTLLNSVTEVVKEHPMEATIAAVGVVAGVALAVAASPVIGAALAVAGVGSAIFSIFH